jgi:hypothetical protein
MSNWNIPALIAIAFNAVAFGIWQGSFAAAAWMFLLPTVACHVGSTVKEGW